MASPQLLPHPLALQQDCRTQTRAWHWQGGPLRPNVTSQLGLLQGHHRNRDQQQPSFTSGWSLSELPRAASASQTPQQGEQTDRGSWDVLKSLERFADSSCPKKSQDAATCSRSLKPGPETNAWQQDLRLQWEGKEAPVRRT